MQDGGARLIAVRGTKQQLDTIVEAEAQRVVVVISSALRAAFHEFQAMAETATAIKRK
jgi:hypothetical protein